MRASFQFQKSIYHSLHLSIPSIYRLGVAQPAAAVGCVHAMLPVHPSAAKTELVSRQDGCSARGQCYLPPMRPSRDTRAPPVADDPEHGGVRGLGVTPSLVRPRERRPASVWDVYVLITIWLGAPRPAWPPRSLMERGPPGCFGERYLQPRRYLGSV